MKINTNDFSWGFEIEGLFDTEFVQELKWEENQKGRILETKGDGSVRFDDDDYEFINCNYREVAVGIFNSHKELVRTLKKFDSSNYEFNNSCGIHLHLKPRNQRTRLKFMDYHFIKKLQEKAQKLSPNIKRRILNENGWCRQYKGLQTLRNEFDRKEKYRFVRNHPKGTFEFRFFSADENRVSNVEVFVKIMLKELNKVKDIKTKNYTLKTDEEILIKTRFENYKSNEIKIICAI